MSFRLCPLCAKPGRPLTSASEYSVVDYYRCDDCSHVWSHRKAAPDAPAVDVTIKPSTDGRAS